ncbi:MAG: ATP-binding protein [Sandaracinaceae bacterium]
MLRELDALDSAPEPLFDHVAVLAAKLLSAPIALVSLVDAERRWLLARVGVSCSELPREGSICGWVIHDEALITVPDATEDPRLADDPLVRADPTIRSYAGAPLMTERGAVGTLCVFDREPRRLDAEEQETLTRLAAVVTEALLLRREARFAERRDRLLRAAEAVASIGHFRVSFRDRCVSLSDRAHQIGGTEPGSAAPTVGEALEAFHPDDRPDVERQLREACPFDLEARVVRPDGQARRVRLSGVPERSGDATVGLLGVVQDVTEHDQLTIRLAHAEKMASLGTLAAGVADEVSNPLNYVKVNAIALTEEMERWLAEDASTRVRDLAGVVDEIRDGALRIEKIVDGLKLFSRRTDGRPEAVELARVFALAERLCANELRHRARFTLVVNDPVTVRADETELVQVAVNLIVNACHAIEAGDVAANEIRVNVGRMGDTAYCIVSDTGRGMTEEVARQAFTPFFTTRELGDGTGLGLAICHGIVTALGGTIAVDSKPGVGTSITIELPAPDGSSPELRVARAAPEVAEPLRILIVDDEALVARSIARMFRDHQVEVHEDPHRALAAIEAGPRPDVILCDLMMPVLSGAAFRDAVAAIDPTLAARIVVITGGAYTEEGRAFLASGVPVVEKPVDIARLRATIDALTGRGEPPLAHDAAPATTPDA